MNWDGAHLPGPRGYMKGMGIPSVLTPPDTRQTPIVSPYSLAVSSHDAEDQDHSANKESELLSRSQNTCSCNLQRAAQQGYHGLHSHHNDPANLILRH